VAEKKVLLLTDGVKPNVYLSARNLPTVHVMPYSGREHLPRALERRGGDRIARAGGGLSMSDAASHHRAPDRHREELGRRIRSAASTRSKWRPTATKHAIKEAIERLFGVKVTGVWTSIARGKSRRVGSSIGRRPHVKKAIVKLRDGDSIAVFEG
jgi:ribosomal protein L23